MSSVLLNKNVKLLEDLKMFHQQVTLKKESSNLESS